jgi:hypothetical protein
MRHAITAATLCSLPLAAFAQPYHYAINQPASTLSYNLALNAPFLTTPSGSSYIVGSQAGPDGIIGNADDTASPPGSRTIPGFSGGNLALNQIVNLNSGSLAASGNSGATVIHPSGALDISYNTAAGTCSLSGFSSSLLGGGTASIDATATVNYSTFRTREPSCTVFGLGNITVPVGTITATSITATQTGSAAAGTLTPVSGQPGHYTFAANVPANIVIVATLSGTPVPLDPQPVTLSVTGTVDLTSASAPVTVQAVVNQTQTVTDDTVLDALAFSAAPLCTAPLYIKITLDSTSTTIGTTANLTASGTLAACGPADIGRQGGLPGADSHLDNNDFVVFIDYFFNGNPLADRGIQGGLPGHDGHFDNNDFVVFSDQFFTGC